MLQAYKYLFYCSLLLLTACNRDSGFVPTGSVWLQLTPPELLTPAKPSTILSLTNPSHVAINWKIRITQDHAPWFDLSKTSGRLDKGQTISLNLKLFDDLEPGVYRAELHLKQADQTQTYQVIGLIGESQSNNPQSARLSGRVVTSNELVSVNASGQTAIAAAQHPRFVPGQVLVKYRESASGTTDFRTKRRLQMSQSLQHDYPLRLLEPGLPGQHDVLETDRDVLWLVEQLRRDPRVAIAEPNYLLEPLELPNDPRIKEQWALGTAGLPIAWLLETGSTHPVTVAVIDTGFDLKHPDLQDRFLPGYDFCASSKTSATTQATTCHSDDDPGYSNPNNFHGTHVSGIIAARGNNLSGIAGAAYGTSVRLLPIKIFSDEGNTAPVDAFVKGIRWAVGLDVQGVPRNPNAARIINLSLGGLFKSDLMQDAINEARQQGALVLAATGNDGNGTVRTPAAAEYVLGIGSINADFKRSSFSNYSVKQLYGPGMVDLMLPGGTSNSISILSTVPDGYGFASGTSMATPMAAGIAALILSQNPGLSLEGLEQRLLASTYVDPSFMKPEEYGQGVLRADLALGLPGPGSTVHLILDGPTLRSGTTTLDAYGTSQPFEIDKLEPGNYRLHVLANGSSAQLAKTISLQLSENQNKTLEILLP